MYHDNIGRGGWVRLVQNGIQCRALVKMLMNLRVP
jgi:hypothetical protein